MKSIDAADAKWKPHYQDTDTFWSFFTVPPLNSRYHERSKCFELQTDVYAIHDLFNEAEASWNRSQSQCA
jgi:hypothetical protein